VQDRPKNLSPKDVLFTTKLLLTMHTIHRGIYFLILASLSLIPCISYSHTGVKCTRAVQAKTNSILWPDQPKRPFDVLKYQLILDWRKIFATKSQKFSGVNVITIQVTTSTPNILLDAGLMFIDSIAINGNPLTTIPQPTSDQKLIIPLPLNLQNSGGAPLTLRIGYHKDLDSNLGIYFFPKGSYDDYDKDYTTEDLAYTMSEPEDAHYWMPCMDLPYDKAESEISIIVPNGIEAASNGVLVSKQAYSSNSTIWNWKSDEPISTYLMVADASTFIHWEDVHQRSTNPGDTVHLDFYAWPSDYYQDSVTDGSVYNAKMALGPTSQIMTYLEAHYGGFPFVKYGQVPVSPFTFGGMEHQTITTIHRHWLKGQQQGIAHEMAHQWFGDKTTCETFKDLWLNEGFATYSEAIWYESWGGYNWYIGCLRGDKAYAFFYDKVHNKLPTYDPPADDPFNNALTYSKGACVLHMLRRMVNNDTMFFDALKDYSNAFAYTTANTAQFRDYIGQRLGLDLYEYFDQWIFEGGFPIYDTKWAQNINNTLFLRVNQLQTVRDHFTMPLRFFAYHGSAPSIDTLIFENNLQSQSFQKNLNYTIDSLAFDDDALLLSEYVIANGDTVNSTSTAHSRLLRNSPELAVHTNSDQNSDLIISHEGKDLICKFKPRTTEGVLELYNSVGMKVAKRIVESGETMKSLSIGNLSSGVYFVRYSAGIVNETCSVNIVR